MKFHVGINFGDDAVKPTVDHKEAGLSVGACRTSWGASPAKGA